MFVLYIRTFPSVPSGFSKCSIWEDSSWCVRDLFTKSGVLAPHKLKDRLSVDVRVNVAELVGCSRKLGEWGSCVVLSGHRDNNMLDIRLTAENVQYPSDHLNPYNKMKVFLYDAAGRIIDTQPLVIQSSSYKYILSAKFDDVRPEYSISISKQFVNEELL